MRRQLVQLGWEVYEDGPKSDASGRTIALNGGTVAAMMNPLDPITAGHMVGRVGIEPMT